MQSITFTSITQTGNKSDQASVFLAVHFSVDQRPVPIVPRHFAQRTIFPNSAPLPFSSTMEELRRYLVEFPQELGFKGTELIKANVFKALYLAVTANGKFTGSLFDHDQIPDLAWKELQSWKWDPNDVTGKQFYEFERSEPYTHSASQACARLLGTGESVYRCADCGYDDTCVLCQFCFNRADHVGHNVTVYLSGANGGVCDCGDDSAFTKKLHCACLTDDGTDDKLDDAFQEAINNTIEVVLDYILDVTNFSVNTLPLFHRNINSRGDLQISSPQLSEWSSLPKEVYGIEDINSDEWYLVLWNDEDHDYPEAETGIRAATAMSDFEAKQTALEINAKGRAILKTASRYDALLSSQKSAEADGLVATICTARDYFREEIVSHMFSWLKLATTFEGCAAFREHTKTALADLLLLTEYSLPRSLPIELLKSNSIDIPKACYENGVPQNGQFYNMQPIKVKPGAQLRDLQDPVTSILYRDPTFEITNCRIIFLLAFEIRLVSQARSDFVDCILPILMSDYETKIKFCERFMTAYPMLQTILAFSDREEDLASIRDLSVQLFTCPLVNKWIVDSNSLPILLSSACLLIEQHASKPNTDGIRNLIDVVVDIRSKREKSAIQKTIKTAVDTIERVFSKNNHQNLLNYILSDDVLPLFVHFLRYFQGICPIKRKYGAHVEREFMAEFYSFLLKALPVLTIVKLAATAEALDQPKLTVALPSVVKYLSTRAMDWSKNGVANFHLSKDFVSNVNPINAFVSYLLQKYDMVAFAAFVASEDLRFMRISDFSLRSLVLRSQVKIGFWIRNGSTVSRQAVYLTDILPDISYVRDFHLNQVAAVVDDPTETFLNFLSRWELDDWYFGNTNYSKTIYEHRFGFICEQFILFIFNLITDRRNFNDEASQSNSDARMKMSIAYALCEEPQPYTKLRKSIGVNPAERATFDRLLPICADYQAPTGLYDVGMYRLKPEMYEELDPLSHLNLGMTKNIFEALFNNLAKTQNVEPKSVILTPRVHPSGNKFVDSRIGEFVRTKDFAKFVYKLLQVALDDESEEFLPHLLHLIHAVIIEGEAVYGEDYVPSDFISIPICNLLLAVAESELSSNVVLKAGFLLDLLWRRSSAVNDSLISSFGEAHVEQFKKRTATSCNSKRQRSMSLASKRKNKVMQKFAKQREEFMKRNNVEEDDVAMDENESGELELRRCVKCGESEDFENPFCVTLNCVTTTAFWQLPPNLNKFEEVAFQNFPGDLGTEEEKTYSEGFSHSYMRSGIVASTCGHGIHAACHLAGSLRPPFCPLCQTIQESVIPTFKAADESQFIPDDLIDGSRVYDSLQQIPEEPDVSKNNLILRTAVNAKYFTSDLTLHSNHMKCIFEPKAKQFDINAVSKKLNLYTQMISNTIRAHEMASRMDGDQSNSTFIRDVPGHLKTLVRSLIQSRALLFRKYQLVLCTQKTFPRSKGQHTRSIFHEVVHKFLNSKELFSSLMLMGYVKLIQHSVHLLQSTYAHIMTQIEFPKVSERCWMSFSKYVLASESLSKFSTETDAAIWLNLYRACERLLLPFLRQCAMFIDIVKSIRTDDSTYQSCVLFNDLFEKTQAQDYQYSTSPLCALLQLPELYVVLESALDINEANKHLACMLQTYKLVENQSVSSLADYPNAPRLIALPEDYNTTITDPLFDVSKHVVCLVCASYVEDDRKFLHSKLCSSMALFFSPDSNTVTCIIELDQHQCQVEIPGPYMTKHGELKTALIFGNATLNYMRYNHLNKLWVNQELFGYVTRRVFGGDLGPFRQATLNEDSEMESEDDEDLIIGDPEDQLNLWAYV